MPDSREAALRQDEQPLASVRSADFRRAEYSRRNPIAQARKAFADLIESE
jgi:hypothetical protein